MLPARIKLSEFIQNKETIKRQISGKEDELSDLYKRTSPVYPKKKPLLTGTFEFSRITDSLFSIQGSYHYEPYQECRYCNSLISYKIEEKIEQFASPEPDARDENLYLIKKNQINLIEIIEESVFLVLPTVLSCSSGQGGGCDKNFIKKTKYVYNSPSEKQDSSLADLITKALNSKKDTHT